MKAKLEVDLKPFTVPNFAIIEQPPKPRQEGLVENPGIPLREIDSFTLYKMCEEFKSSVFKKAGKEMPPEAK